MKQEELAAAAGVTNDTISNFEGGRHVPRKATLDAIVMSLENRGIEFTNGDSPGVRLRPEKAIIPV
jgi:transcriptional regulator with XRE-family HTH domain